MAEVILHQLSKIYADTAKRAVPAVKGIDLEIAAGEFMVLVGPSGCGKSTTLRMIAGLEEISGGTLTIDGHIVNDILPKDRDIAMVFQNYALYPHMSVYQNMAFGLVLRKLPKSEIDRRVQAAAQQLGLVDYLDRKPKALSGGQRQRVAVGRAIVRHPKVFLFDEPLSNLDAKMRVAMRGELSRLHARLGATMIYVTHDQVEAMTMGDRICVMNDGRIMQTATPLELYNRPANLFVAGFIGSPPMNLFSGTLQAAPAGGLRFVEADNPATPVTLPLPDALARRATPLRGRPAVLGLRPEHFAPVAAANASAAATLRAKVELTELMGAETIVHLNTGRTTFLARLAPNDSPAPGSTLDLAADLSRAHLFDPATGQALP